MEFKMKRFIATMMIIGLVLAPVAAMAASFTFDGGPGGSGTDWGTAVNWNPDTGFTGGDWQNIQGDDLTIDGSFSPIANNYVQLGANNATASLTVDTSGTVTFDGDTVTSWGNLTLGNQGVGLLTQKSGTIIVTNAFAVGYENGTNTGTNRYDMDGGVLKCGGWNISFHGIGHGSATSKGLVDQTAGSVTYGAGPSSSVNIAGGGGLGVYQISGGSLTINSLTFGLAGLTSQGTAGADARLEIIGTGPTSIATSASTDMYVWDGGTVKFTMGAGGVTPITAGGAVNLSGTTTDNLVLDFTGLTGSGDITLIDKTSGGAISGAFANAPDGTTYESGRFELDYTGGDGNDLVLLDLAPSGQPGTLIYGK
jgi:hypothetical protein